MKTCSLCLKLKEFDQFHMSTRDGTAARCKDCANEFIRAYDESHKTERLEYFRKWREANRKKQREYFRLEYLQNQERRKKYRRDRQKTNADKIRAHNQRRHARKKNCSVNDFTAQQWVTIKTAYGGRCVYCGIKPDKLTADHVIPLAKGGNHTASNIVPACMPCNNRKKAGPAPKQVVLPHSDTNPTTSVN